MARNKRLLPLDSKKEAALISAALDAKPVSGLTHNHYKYPARFSPQFVHAAIEAFTSPGDTIMDPFVGGGTTCVEAMASGRNGIGIDISSLATFVTEAKTTLLSDNEVKALRHWAAALPETITMRGDREYSFRYEALGYFRNIDTPLYWRLRKCIEQALASISTLRSGKARIVARCAVLRAAQWALDSRKQLPSVSGFRAAIYDYAIEVIEGTVELRNRISRNTDGQTIPLIRCFNASIVGFHNSKHAEGLPTPRLVLTSPPYPGVHVLYHRWQVDGRKETPAPFWIANKLDGSGASYYTLGDRKNPNLKTYFEELKGAFESITRLCDRDTSVVQVVAFSEPKWQLPRYLAVAKEAGLRECFLSRSASSDGRLWRTVPNRRWYADQRGQTNGSQEVVLFHSIGEPCDLRQPLNCARPKNHSKIHWVS